MPRWKKKQKGATLGPLFSMLAGAAGSVTVHRGKKPHIIVPGPRPPRPKPPTPPGPPPPEKCPCVAFKTLDLMWQQKSSAEKKLWNDAVKKRATSGYQVWMKESMALCQNCGMLPAQPSPSGGFSLGSLIPSAAEVPPAGGWIGKYPIPPPTPPVGPSCPHCIGDNPNYHLTRIFSVIGAPAFFNGYYITTQYSLCSWKLDTTWGTLYDGLSLIGPNVWWLVNAVVDAEHRAVWSLNTGIISCWSTLELPFVACVGYPPNDFAGSWADIKPSQPYFP